MSIPIEEMLLDLQTVLEAFQEEPASTILLNAVLKDASRIAWTCESLWVECEGDD